jgi:hypothetical protein
MKVLNYGVLAVVSAIAVLLRFSLRAVRSVRPLSWNRSGFFSSAICSQGASANPFSSPEVRALLQREPVKVADRVVVASGIHDHLQRMCARG